MAKRFLESGTFRNEFMRSLPAQYKLFYLYLLCECDHCGIWSVEIDVASLRIGATVTRSEALQHFKNKIVEFDNGKKWFIPNFIFFQYGDISSGTNKIHKSVCSRLEKNNLFQFVLNENTVDEINNSQSVETLPEDLPKGYQRVTEDHPQSANTLKVKDKDKDKVKEKEKEKGDLISFDLRGEKVSSGTEIPTSERTQSTANGNAKLDERKQIISTYSEWMKERGLPVRIDVADASAVKKIVLFLSKFETVTEGKKSVAELFNYILSSWNLLTPWLQTQTQLKQINSQLPTIVETLKTKQNGKQSYQNTQQQSLSDLANALRNSIGGGTSM